MHKSAAFPRRKRLALGRTPRRQSFERKLRIWLTLLGSPFFVLTGLLATHETSSIGIITSVVSFGIVAWAVACSILFEQIIRPLQTLTNVVSALREDDFSFRARGACRGDSVGELALEINALASTLQQQRTKSIEALSLVERVMSSFPSPVLAFDDAGHLRLLNAAAERALSLDGSACIGEPAVELSLLELFNTEDKGTYTAANYGESNVARWSVRRSVFRLHGIAHALFLLNDVDAVLREEERSAWQRLIRVLGHEINNSLAPIKSIAGSLRSMRHRPPSEAGAAEDLDRGLSIIEDRAASLNRFLQAYQRLTRLPPPKLEPIAIELLLMRAASLETRVPVALVPGPPTVIPADADQIEQLLINLIQNAADAVLSQSGLPGAQAIVVSWRLGPNEIVVRIDDSGPGLLNPANIFVPFYTTKTTGTGIGLVLARSIAVAHGGSLSLVNRSGTPGCTAELHLPLTVCSRHAKSGQDLYH